MLFFAHTASAKPLELSLQGAIKVALKQNISIMSYYDSIESSELDLMLRASDFDTKFTPNVSYSRADGEYDTQTYGMSVDKKLKYGTSLGASVETYITDNSDEAYTSTAAVTLTQPLLRSAGTRYNTASLLGAREGLLQQERSLELARQSLIINCISSYCGIIESQLMLKAYKKSHNRTKELLSHAQVKLELGTVSKMDVYRAEISLLQSETSLISYNESVASQVDDFKLLLGLPLNSELALTDKDFSRMREELIPLDEAIRLARRNRLELKSYHENIAAYERSLFISRRNLSPPLDLSVSANFTGNGDAFKGSTTLDEESWNISISSSLDLERKSEKVNYLNAQLTLNRARRELRQYEDEIVIEVKNRYRNVTQNLKKIALQKKSVEASQKQLEFTTLRYSAGEIDNLTVIEAQENVIQAEVRYYSAITDYIVSLYNLKKSIGTLDSSEYLGG